MCNINYHMVWSVKYRRKILNSGIEEYLKELVQQIAEDKALLFIYLNAEKHSPASSVQSTKRLRS